MEFCEYSWRDRPTVNGLRGSLIALLLLFASLQTVSCGIGVKAANHTSGEREMRYMHIFFYGGKSAGEPLSHCKIYARWKNPDGSPAARTLDADDDECAHHQTNSWFTCGDERFSIFFQTGTEITETIASCDGEVEIMLVPQQST